MAKITLPKKTINRSAVNNGSEQTNYFEALSRLLAGSDKDLYKKGQKVDPEKAQACADNFQDLLTNVTDHHLLYFRIKYAETFRVAFAGVDLNNYIKEMVDLGEKVVNNIKIVFGIYTEDFVKYYPTTLRQADIDKLSVFLWPYLDDNPSQDPHHNLLPPYNLGGMEP